MVPSMHITKHWIQEDVGHSYTPVILVMSIFAEVFFHIQPLVLSC